MIMSNNNYSGNNKDYYCHYQMISMVVAAGIALEAITAALVVIIVMM